MEVLTMLMYLLRVIAHLFIWLGFVSLGAMLGIVAKVDFPFWVLLAVLFFGLALTVGLVLKGLKKQKPKNKVDELKEENNG